MLNTLKNKRYFVLMISFLMGLSCSYQKPSKKPENIIVMIGDGMGIEQITSAMYSSVRPLNFNRFKRVGLMTNHSYDHIVTDSAASATAMATGVKTYNTAISVDSERKPVKTIMELAKEKGYSIGVVVTCSVTHATPAAFLAHTENRNLQYEIALDIVELEPDIVLGGGLKYFQNRKDGRDLIQELENKNYQIFYDWKKLANMNISDTNKKIIGLFAQEGLPPVVKTKPNPDSRYYDFIVHSANFNQVRSLDYLVQMVRKAIEYLEKKGKPYFLMIEGSQIDWGGHNMDASYIIGEVLDFDRAIGVVLNYAEREQNTLVVVTADHETGGFSIIGGNMKVPSQLKTKFVHEKHTSRLIPVFSYGPGSETFVGIFDNTDIFKKIKKVWF